MYDASCMATLRGNFNVHLSAYVGACICDASRLRNCENSAEYINRSHEWKASVPIYPQKMRTGRIFSTTGAAFFFFFLSALEPGVICATFHDWSVAHSSTNCCNCLRKGRHLSLWLELVLRADNTKQTLLA